MVQTIVSLCPRVICVSERERDVTKILLIEFICIIISLVDHADLQQEDATRELKRFTKSLLQSQRRHKEWLAACKGEEIKRAAKAVYELQEREEQLTAREEAVTAREARVRELEEEYLKLQLENENLKAQLLAVRNDEFVLEPEPVLPPVQLTAPEPVAATAFLVSEWLEQYICFNLTENLRLGGFF